VIDGLQREQNQKKLRLTKLDNLMKARGDTKAQARSGFAHKIV